MPTGVLIVLALVGAYLYIPAFQTTVQNLIGGVTLSGLPGTSGGDYIGNVQFIINIQDALTGATVTPTSDDYFIWNDMPSDLEGGLALTTAGHTLSVDSDGEMWISFGTASDYLFSSAKFESLNSQWLLPGGFWADLNDDNGVDYVAHIDVSDAGVTGQAQTPVINLVAPWVGEDATLTLSAPADADNTGATETTVTVVWTITDCAADDGFSIGRLYFTVNGTYASGLCHPEDVTVSNFLGGGGRSYWSDPTEIVEGSTSYYYYITGDPDYRHMYNGEMYWTETGEPSTMYISASFRVDLVAGALVNVYIDQVDNAGNITNDTDAVNINIQS